MLKDMKIEKGFLRDLESTRIAVPRLSALFHARLHQLSMLSNGMQYVAATPKTDFRFLHLLWSETMKDELAAVLKLAARTVPMTLPRRNPVRKWSRIYCLPRCVEGDSLPRRTRSRRENPGQFRVISGRDRERPRLWSETTVASGSCRGLWTLKSLGRHAASAFERPELSHGDVQELR